MDNSKKFKDTKLQQQQQRYLCKTKKLIEFDVEYWKQRTKVNYQNKGDVNSKKFMLLRL